MILFDKNIASTIKPWFSSKLSDDFSISIEEKSAVIFGFNGIGKSTIFQCIKSLDNKDTDYLDYQSKDQSILDSSSLKISINIKTINDLDEKMLLANKSLNVKDELKQNSSITSDKHAEKISKSLLSERKNDDFSGYRKVKKDIQNLIDKYPSVLATTLFSVWPDLVMASNTVNEIKKDQDNMLFNALLSVSYLLDNKTKICPICDSEANDLKNKVEMKMKALSSIKSAIVEALRKSGINVTQSLVDEYINACSELNKDQDLLIDYSVCGGKIDRYEAIEKALADKKFLVDEKEKLRNEAKDKYENVRLKKESLVKDLNKYFQIDPSSVIFDDENFIIEIRFPRSIGTYCTGEINLILFMYRIYSFLGSDKNILILDDPASSLDLINHYKIAYEIVKTSREKKVVVLTHSVELLNTINSQYRNHFDFFYLESCNNEITIEKIENKKEITNVISYEQLNNSDVFVQALVDREKSDSPNHDVFHHSEKPLYLLGNPSNMSNHDMCKLIDEFSCFNKNNFYTSTLEKIKYLSALRVWVEKKLYELIDASDDKNRKKFMKKKQLNQKIDFIFPLGASSGFKIGSLTKDDLMSKKVMLNQGVHYYSQVMPMAYAINISLDDLANEITEIKKLFKRKEDIHNNEEI